jgi:hypothetical protein
MNGKDGHFEQVADSKNVSQLIRSNTPHYWNYCRAQADLKDLKPQLSFEGVLAGDPHMGNFSVLPVQVAGGGREMRFVDVDFDDAGRGPFVLDFMRYVIACKSVSSEIKRHDLQDAYLKGLATKEVEPPREVRELLRMSTSEYDRLAEDYVAKHTTPKGFELTADEIAAYDAKIARSTIAKLFSGETVVDLAIRPRERGGSADQLRIWVLVEDKSTRRRIVELTQYAKPALSFYQAQPPVKEWLSEIRRAFWPGLDGSAYDLIEIPGAGLFWTREKHVSLIDVPYSSDKSSKLDFAIELARYDANQLGLAHGRQAHADAYRASIEKDPAAFHDAMEPIEKSYMESAVKALKKGS